jgi:hypothetical protein
MPTPNFAATDHFSPDEFSEDPTIYGDFRLFNNALFPFREWWGRPIYPSPAEGALARFSGPRSSHHYVGPRRRIERRSTAVDVFPEGDPFRAWLLAVSCGVFGAVGWYPHTNGPNGRPWPMLHLDVRKPGEGHSHNHPLLWMRDDEGYHYIHYPNYAGKAVEMSNLLQQWAGNHVTFHVEEDDSGE